jgi:hypothetical protein
MCGLQNTDGEAHHTYLPDSYPFLSFLSLYTHTHTRKLNLERRLVQDC